MAVADYAEKDADMLSSTGNSQTGEHVFTRGWKPQATERRATIEAELRAILVVTNPKTDRGKSEHLGTYDVVASGWDGKYGGYIQTLKKRMPYQIPASPSEGTVVSEDVYQQTLETQYFNQESPPTVTYWELYATGGILRVLSAAVDALKKWRVELRTVKSKYSLITFQITSRLNGAAETHYICRNEVPAAGGGPKFTGVPTLVAGYVHDFAGSPSRNSDGTWNWYLVVKQDDLAIKIGETKTIYKYNYITRLVETNALHNGGFPYPQKRWQYAIQSKAIQYKAVATADAAWALSPSTMPQKIAEGLWLARIESAESAPFWQWDVYTDGPVLTY